MLLNLDMADLDLLGAEGLGDSVVGDFDIAAKQHQMNTLKKVTVAIALALVRGANQVMAHTAEIAKGHWYERSLDVSGSLAKTKGHIDWHASELGKYSDPTAFYGPGDDLKKWAMQAFIDSNAVAYGRAWQDQAISKAAGDWVDMWADIGAELAKLPAKIVAAVAHAAGDIASGAAGGLAAGLGIPKWLFVGGLALLIVGTGFGVFKILLVTAPAVVPAVVKRYMP